MPDAARALFAVLAGFLIVTLGALSFSIWGSAAPMPGSLATALPGVILAFAAFVLAGYVTARLAPDEPMRHVIAVAGIGAFMTVLTTLSPATQSGWNAAGSLVLLLLGLPAGGTLGRRHRR